MNGQIRLKSPRHPPYPRSGPKDDYLPPRDHFVGFVAPERAKDNRIEIAHLVPEKRRARRRYRTLCGRTLRRNGSGGINVCGGFQWWARTNLCRVCERSADV
jgi:hypothetical protein